MNTLSSDVVRLDGTIYGFSFDVAEAWTAWVDKWKTASAVKWSPNSIPACLIKQGDNGKPQYEYGLIIFGNVTSASFEEVLLQCGFTEPFHGDQARLLIYCTSIEEPIAVSSIAEAGSTKQSKERMSIKVKWKHRKRKFWFPKKPQFRMSPIEVACRKYLDTMADIVNERFGLADTKISMDEILSLRRQNPDLREAFESYMDKMLWDALEEFNDGINYCELITRKRHRVSTRNGGRHLHAPRRCWSARAAT